ncbi:MAG TPA: beta-ketoacyl-ACP synthase II [Ktedonobacterales bacterium]|nr:beta-ketoacyl-ACP synthase II [Ktedonobacterales bacterium]
MGKRRVVVTGMGLVTPLGNDVPTTWKALCEGRSGVTRITGFDVSEQHAQIAAPVRDFDATQYMERRDIRRNDPFVHFAMAAVRQALDDAKFAITDANREEVGVIIGSGVGGLQVAEEQFRLLFERGPDRISPFFITRFITDMAAGYVSITLKAQGPNFATVSACATGAHAIGESYEIIRRGDADAILAGGTESGIVPLSLAAFGNMHALSRRNDEPEKASRPFDGERDGFVMGEGAGILLLEEREGALARGAHIYAEVVGYAATADAFHVTEPAPEGSGLARAMRRALEKARLTPADVDYINAHGTSTPLNDKNETQAIKAVFGAAAHQVAISSTKSMTGHTLGAAGGIEAAICALAIERGVMPPTINQTTPDPECDLDYVPNSARKGEVRVAMSNSMGFGGHNAVLVLRRHES